MSNKHTKHRSRSGADEQCPYCLKKLRGQKGLALHMLDEHSERTFPPHLAEFVKHRMPSQFKRIGQ
ncbi:MAG: hypothetical protein KDJ19_00570 [Hyphomicrobiaceae bacterium]|nr:hypothetical protein [Hyphomicrobiaceae bacterium]MCC0024601.1 hypothetical protein [Hyphomicrobiaceae bacterium]